MSDARRELLEEPALRGVAAPPPLPGAAGARRAAASATAEVAREPALGAAGAAPAPDAVGADPNGVWGEPALADAPAAGASRERHAAWVAAQWAGAGRGLRAAAFLGLALAAGPFAVLFAVLRETIVSSPLAAVTIVPVAEELAKAAMPLMTLEKRPWLFSSGGSVAALCALSGLVFASIENVLYLFVYLRDPTPGLVLWRLVVCTALHVGCASLSGAGLARVWRRAAAERAAADVSIAAPWTIAAMVAHGAYNGLATVWELLAPLAA